MPTTIYTCLQCGNLTTNTKFCNRSCQGTYNNLNRSIESNLQKAKNLSLFYKNKRNKATQEYNENPKKCKFCDNSLLFESKQKSFCNSSCAAKYNNTGRIQTEESKKKRSESLIHHSVINPKSKKEIKIKTCTICYSLYFKNTKTCSKQCYCKNLSMKISLWLKTHRSHIKGRSKQSYMEESFEKWLIANNIHKTFSGFLSETHFYNKTTKKNGFADFIFPRKRLIIELDGTHHLKRIELDRIRDEHLNKRGWNVIRITQKEYIKGTRIEEIKKLLNIS